MPGTIFLTMTDRGEVELMTDNPAVMGKARQDHAAGADNRTFVYRDGEDEGTVTGRVTWLNEEPNFRFAVLPDEAE